MSLVSAAPVQGIPTLAEPSESQPGTGNATPRGAADAEEKKPKKRGLFGFGKKKTTEDPPKPAKASPSKSMSPTRQTTTASPIQIDHSHHMPSSPGRSPFAASSPRLSSPAGSQIFERDVQESASALMPNSPAIPSHIQTENYIPPVLDASSEAITDGHLDPDTVEIITHTSHQPASVAVTGAIGSHHNTSPHNEPTASWADELAAFSAERTAGSASASGGFVAADSASNYGSFDTTDVRRLSFISFADVVQAEQQQQHQQGAQHPAAGSRDSMHHLAGLTSLASVGIVNRNRSPSPIRSRSPVSSSGGGGVASSPPTSKSGSVKGMEMSPTSKKPLGSPSLVAATPGSPVSLSAAAGAGPGPTVSGEIAIETMAQALRRTGSGDLEHAGVMRSLPGSPI
ncbi:hypothetical protein MMYC01_208101 [Madurella mycetomatis]|uniref:Uncharacterized protein n=1 Tax=Madurella mycetomatis TaxID=100816 RepID=A0A175VZM8_9PEZI|nr:hypothetical protein MMYC01_208101 [Madurella mycetomatis]